MRHIAFVAMLTVTTGPQVCLADGLDVNSARNALATCVQTSVKQLLAKPGLTPIGLAAFVGLNCASARDAYQQSLEHAGVAEVPKLMQQVDTRIVAFVVRAASANVTAASP